MVDMSTLKGVFKKHIPNPDPKRFAKLINKLELEFKNRNDKHIRFFGGHLLGVEADGIRWVPSDTEYWFNEIMQVDMLDLTDDLHGTKEINKNWAVTGSPFNLSAIWLVYIFWNSDLKEKDKREAMINTLIVFHYKAITSKLFRNFKFNASPELMETVYASMSKKYLIKRTGTWYKLLRLRAEDNLAPDSPHSRRNVWQRFDNDRNIMYAISDNVTRLTSIFAEHYKLINEIREGDRQMMRTKIMQATDDGLDIVELKRELPALEHYIFSILSDRNSFIKRDLVEAIQYKMPTMPPSLFMGALEAMVKEYQSEAVKSLVESTMIHAFRYIFDEFEGEYKKPDLERVVDEIKGIYTSSRSKDPKLLKLRSDYAKWLGKRFRKSSESSIASARTGLMLYIVLRAMTRKHYAN